MRNKSSTRSIGNVSDSPRWSDRDSPHVTALELEPRKCRGAAAFKHVDRPHQLGPAWRRSSEFREGRQQQPAPQFPRQIEGLDNERASFRADAGADQRSKRPVQCLIGIPDRGGACRQPRGVGPFTLLQPLAYSAAIMLRIAIGRIVDRFQPCPSHKLFQFRFAPVKKGPDQLHIFRQGTARAHSAQSAHARSAQEAHHQRFRLVIGMMCGRYGDQPTVECPFVEQPVPHRARGRLDVGLGDFRPVGEQDLVPHAQRLGGANAHEGTTIGVLHRTWIDLRSAISRGDPVAAIQEAERGEHFSRGVYRDALESMLPPTARELVETQYAELRRTAERLRELEA